MHLRDRIDDANDVLAPLGPLLKALAASPVASKFYTYSSLNRLCFSASSHYPWVDDGLPVIAPCGGGTYFVGTYRVEGVRSKLAQAIALVEEGLRTSSYQPFFGSEPHYELPLLTELLASMGSSLRAELAQDDAWFTLVVRALAPHSSRYTIGTLCSVFVDGARQLRVNWPTRDDAARAIRRYCEDGASLEDVANDPLAQVVSTPARL